MNPFISALRGQISGLVGLGLVGLGTQIGNHAHSTFAVIVGAALAYLGQPLVIPPSAPKQ